MRSDSVVHLRVPAATKGRWIRASRAAGMRLTDWIVEAVEAQMIDARTNHAPGSAPGLVAQAIEACGSQKECAARAGVSARYLQMLARNEREMSYALQVTLERIVLEAD